MAKMSGAATRSSRTSRKLIRANAPQCARWRPWSKSGSNDLPEMQRKVLALYYFEDLRLREIAEAFGVTESRICQIHAQAIMAIKSLLQTRGPGGL